MLNLSVTVGKADMCYSLCLWIEDVYISISNLWFSTKKYLGVTVPINKRYKQLHLTPEILKISNDGPDCENKIIDTRPSNDFEGNNTIII